MHTLTDLVRCGFGPALVPQHIAQMPDARTLHAVALPPAPDGEWVVSAVVTSAPPSPTSCSS